MHVDQIVDFDGGASVEGFATEFGRTALGEAGAVVLPVCIAVSTFGAANGSAFSGGACNHTMDRGPLSLFATQLWFTSGYAWPRMATRGHHSTCVAHLAIHGYQCLPVATIGHLRPWPALALGVC
jgi:hypothetical protein